MRSHDGRRTLKDVKFYLKMVIFPTCFCWHTVNTYLNTYSYSYSFLYSNTYSLTYTYTHCPTYMYMYANAHVRKLVTVVWMCAGILATEAKTSGKYDHFQENFYIFKGSATIMRSHWNRKCFSTGKNGKWNCGKILHLIELLNVRGKWGVIGRTLTQYMTVHTCNIIQWWVLRARRGLEGYFSPNPSIFFYL